jgi:hypothetical protein
MTYKFHYTYDGADVEESLIIANDSSLSHDLLIGESFLCHELVTFIELGDKFIVGRADQKPFLGLELPEATSKQVKLSALSKTVIRANTVMRIKARVEEAPDGGYLQYRPGEAPALISDQNKAYEVGVAKTPNC